jgi:signal peptidase I
MQHHPRIIDKLVEHIKVNILKPGETIVIKGIGPRPYNRRYYERYAIRIESEEYTAQTVVMCVDNDDNKSTKLDRAIEDRSIESLKLQLRTVRPKEEDPEPEPEPGNASPVSKDPDMLYFLVHFKSVGRDGSAPYEGRAVVKSESYPTGSTIEAWERQLQWRHGATVMMVLNFTPLAKEESEDSDE